ncbi:flagellar hook-associated protein [Caenispirillum salinarum AK4]|uniref:Flagellar hook-associated protein 1 n=1 Tax=Caenispirillum salinarum AK4 TaxID=1238182 RepID=K9GPB0_9PROT|nr:flagellar hook-associated protein FlgK [Caenispirillum salinarum]EKV26534.1 flagellar hook-associated protein [Caenispirillum salinarum AK4]
MSLFSALNNAVTGLKANQIGLDVVSRNVANANTAGYTKKVAPRENAILDGDGAGVRILPTQRQVDQRLLESLRAEISRSERLDTVTDYLTRVDELFGRPDQETSIAYAVNTLSIRMGELVDNPENAGVRKAVIAQADAVARELNQLSGAVQDMRSETEKSLSLAVDEVNNALKGIEQLNREIANREAANLTIADLEDRRDIHLQTLARNMDIRTVERGDGAMTVFTNSGHVLVNERAAQLSFDGRQVLTANDAYSTDDVERGVGSLTLVSPGGTRVDLLQDGPPRQGKIAGLLELRDERLPEAQAQLDEIAHNLALGMADRETTIPLTGTNTRSMDFTDAAEAPITRASGSDQVLRVQDGDRMAISYTQGGMEKSMTVYFVDDASNTDLLNRVPDPDNAVFVDITGVGAQNQGLANRIATAMSSAMPIGGLFSATGERLNISTTTATVSIDDVALHQASTTPVDGPMLNLFANGNSPRIEQEAYTGNLSSTVWEKVGFAGRIGVNTEIADDDTLLVRYTAEHGEVAVGDNARPRFLMDQLTETRFTYSPNTGLGDAAHPYKGTILDLGRAVVSYQGMEATTQQSLSEDQATRTTLLEQRHSSMTGVNVDDELAELILLQSAYSASAKVVQTVDRLFDDLMSLR